MNWKGLGGTVRLGCGLLIASLLAPAASGSDFRFNRDTLAFANSTVFEYREGVPVRRTDSGKEKSRRYTRRCFVMSRTVVQFHKFARFDPSGAALDEKELAKRVRNVTKRRPWHDALPANERVVFPGYANLRELSKAHPGVLQENIGLGWTAYLRIGNFRMFFLHSVRYQEKTHERLNAALARGGMFIAYLSDYPTLHINHSVMVYARKPALAGSKTERYFCYDPNHPDAPRELRWLPDAKAFHYQKDEEFVGGYTRVYQVYGKPFQ